MRSTNGWWLLTCCLSASMVSASENVPPTSPAPVVEETALVSTFETDIWPIFEARCVKCHGAEKLEAGLDVRRRFALLSGGDSGPALVAEKPEESLIWERIEHDEMPPADEGRLDDKQKQLIKHWILAGAPTKANPEPPLEESDIASRLSDEDRQFWSFQPPVRPTVPTVTNQDRVRTPIDAFLLARLEESGYSFNPDATPEQLVRRLYLDLWGLPPTVEQLDQFLNDKRPDAYELLVDQLLDAPQYGERWGRHWLDIAGYADSDGYLAADRLRPEAWRYRDYVINAIYQDLPYDQFILEQLAGDELTNWRERDELTAEMKRQLVATGFLRTAMDPTYPGYVEPNEVHQVLADTMQIVNTTFLGLTVHCARCHSHKFDPLSQKDYYAVQAVLLSGYDPARWQPSEVRGIPLATTAEAARIAERNKKIDERLAELAAMETSLRNRVIRRRLISLLSPAGSAEPDTMLLDQLAAVVVVPAEKRTEEQKALFEKHVAGSVWTDEELQKQSSDFANELRSITKAIEAETKLKQTIVLARGLTDVDGPVAEGRILKRGDHSKPGGTVAPNVPEVLAPVGYQFQVEPGSKTSGRRLAFARWLVDPKHPLTARVHVNRLWARHFGRGIVATQANFGRSGARPTHPELLDWLATEFVEQKWSQKAMHKLMVTSTAYRQSSAVDAAKSQVDPENRLWGAWQPRRVEGEVVRDALLLISGRLNPTIGGPPANVAPQGDGSVLDLDTLDGNRRTVYQIVRRSQHLTLLELFDTPTMEVNCPERTVSIVPLQALALFHGPQAERAAAGLAARAVAAAPSDDERSTWLFRSTTGRRPSEQERLQMTQFLSELVAESLSATASPTPDQTTAATHGAWKELALVLINSNEFVYVH